MLLRLLNTVVWAAVFVAAVIIAGMMAGCATIPCAPNTCTEEQLEAESRDPFGSEPITYGTIFGAQPEPGRVTVQP